jgi:isocitrate/isopropylmalate dehydrogenase
MGTLKDAWDAKNRAEAEHAAAVSSKATMVDIIKKKERAEAAGEAVGKSIFEYNDETADAGDKEAWEAIQTMSEGEGKDVLTIPKKSS